ncbi:hypothetical protein HOU03_gp156 [Caulobacter phage CcrSC]|uniref:Uncharacterized protein n=1 Tax=Caulobacter phage CcrSC TaxID=2283272 RepID=A0A385EFJ2_9CAUD|nr:hypothetical protein HOU03_gp030 [Caulobacter phage CcrSC]YP_009810742.1 hypothetical protein HOU03_gp156 [Caulobacter phage CcrSC]AXQ69612.1 hypothetical protein CcrSC_gp030 [Caulobacter phage CcrSC]AXQ70112.1 hypothetical protein CcrSC_gp530 [Caulobacter phage CcrSC]
MEHRDFVPHIITARTVDGTVYYESSHCTAFHLGYARAMDKADAERRAAAWKRAEKDGAPQATIDEGTYGITVVATTWEALDKARAHRAELERLEANFLAEEAHDDQFDDYEEPVMSPEDIAAEEEAARDYLATIQPHKAGDVVRITDEGHPHFGALATVAEAEWSGYLVLDLGAGLTWGWATGVQSTADFPQP